jgi:hypothetical protein
LALKDDKNFWDKIIDRFKEIEAKYCLQKTETDGWKFKNWQFYVTEIMGAFSYIRKFRNFNCKWHIIR